MIKEIYLSICFGFTLLFGFTCGMFNIFENSEEHQLRRDNYITTLPSIEKSFLIIFKIKPMSYSIGYRNVIHFTLGGDYYRIPGVWFFYDALYPCFFVNGYNDFCYTTQPLSLYNWCTVQISQDLINGVYLYSIYLNGTIFKSIANETPLSFKNVKLYIGDPWWEVQDGFIKDLKILSGSLKCIEELQEHVLTKNNLIVTLPLLEKIFSVSFKIKPKSYSTNDYSSVIHLTTGSDYGSYGDRTPAVWFSIDGSGSLYIASAVNGNHNYGIYSDPLPLNEWSSIRISQSQINEVYIYAIYVNGNNVHSINNTQSQAFSNVNVYAADPWKDAQDGSIKDLRIVNGNEEMCGLLTVLRATNQDGEIHIHVNMTTDCCYLLNLSIYLQPESPLLFKEFLWEDLSLNGSIVKKHGQYLLVQVDTLSNSIYASFSAIFVYGKKIPVGKLNVSVKSHSTWNYCFADMEYKVNSQIVDVPIERSMPINVVKIKPTWIYRQKNGTLLQTDVYQFVCATMQKRRPSPCYQRQILTGMIMFLPINVLDVIGYDSVTTFIYGLTFGNNIIEMDLNKRKPMIITKENCSRKSLCKSFVQ